MAWVEETIANTPTVRAALEAIEVRHDREHSISPSAKSYLYSPDFWWLDMKHVIAGASKAYRSGFLSSWLWGLCSRN